MTKECLKDVRVPMEKENARSGELLSIPNADQDILHLDVASADLENLIVKL